MLKHKCKDCGKIHDTKPDKCSCGGESGFAEVEVIVEKENIDVEKLKSDIKANLEKEMQDKLKDETAKIQNDYLEKLKNNSVPDKKNDEDGKPNEADEASKIELSRANSQIEELTNMVKNLSTEIETERASKKETMVKNEILQRVDKEPYLKDTVQKYLDSGLIKSIEDYDKIISPLKPTLKEMYERKQKDLDAGKDPMGDYGESDKSKTNNKDWKEEAKKKYQDAINLKLGIRK